MKKKKAHQIPLQCKGKGCLWN